MGAENTDTTDTNKTNDTAKTDDTKSTSTTDTDKGAGKAEAGKSTEAEKKVVGDDTSGLKKALQAERKTREALEKQIRDGELAKLPELERYKTLSDELTKENEKLKTENMKRRVAMELGLNWTIGKRITGDSEEDMRADGAELLKQFKQDEQKIKDDPKNKVTNDARKTGSTGGPSMNDKLRALAGRQLKN